MISLKSNLCLYLLTFTIYSIVATPVQANDLASGISNFATQFHWECAKSKPGNVIVSPLSVSTALGLLLQGTNGKTMDELKNGLHLTGDKSAIANQFSEHKQILQRNVGDSTLSIANKIFVQRGSQLNKHFEEVALKKFESGVESLNFAENEQSAQTINHFVEEKTNGKIKDLIKPDMISADTRTVLVNAIYFKGKWEQPFEKNQTQKEDFYINETEKISVDFMHIEADFNVSYSSDLKALAVEFKYANSNFSLVVVLPNSRTGLRTLEEELKGFDLMKIIDKMEEEKVDVRIPKFKVEYDINLNDVLKNLRMGDMFSGNADLSGILETGEQISVSDVFHKAFIEVNEEGTEAAVGMGFGMERISSPLLFQADHPFVYFVRDTVTNTIIFSGRIVKLE